VLTLEDAPNALAHQALGDESTLDDLIVSAWEGLTARRVVACPVCASRMLPRYGSFAQPVEGRCSDCGATLG
jgi:DNA-directed RNA polymerase subunit RPC12/RpoP